MDYKFCPAHLYPHAPHMNDDGTRCPGAPERDDRARTYNPKGATTA